MEATGVGLGVGVLADGVGDLLSKVDAGVGEGDSVGADELGNS